MRVRTVVAGVLSAVALGVGLAAPASAAAEKYALVGPAADVFCSDLTPAPDENISQIAPGFAIFNANQNKVSAVVSVKDAPPNTEFPIRLIQAGGTGFDCFTVDGTLKTNGNGKGTLNVSEAPDGTRAQVIIDTSVLTGTPSYRATQPFVFGKE